MTSVDTTCRSTGDGIPPSTVPHEKTEGHPGMYALGVTVTVIAAGLFIATNIVTFPLSGAISLLALGILSAVTYGIINDQLACRQCIHYFTIGHTQVHKRLLETDDPTLNGIVWGIHATWVLGVVAGIVMAGAALITGLVVAQIMPYLVLGVAVGIGVVCLASHILAKREEEYWKKPENQDELNSYFKNKYILPFDGFDIVNLNDIPTDQRAAYMGVAKRNLAGYIGMPTLGLAGIIGIVALGIIL
jgi:hypothetical protein